MPQYAYLLTATFENGDLPLPLFALPHDGTLRDVLPILKAAAEKHLASQKGQELYVADDSYKNLRVQDFSDKLSELGLGVFPIAKRPLSYKKSGYPTEASHRMWGGDCYDVHLIELLP